MLPAIVFQGFGFEMEIPDIIPSIQKKEIVVNSEKYYAEVFSTVIKLYALKYENPNVDTLVTNVFIISLGISFIM